MTVVTAIVGDALSPGSATAPFEPRHAALRTEVRTWIADNISPHVDRWERDREFPRELFRAAGKAGLLGWKYGPEEGGLGPDPVADVVVTEELACCGSGGVAAGLGSTKDLAPYYLFRFGSSEQREAWLRPAVAGHAIAALAVTEPGAGSDVAALRCAARRDGDAWVLTGEKTFCTNGSRADWVLVAARTGEGAGAHGVSLFVVPTDAQGFSATRIPTLGWRTSQTGLLRLDDVRIPAGCLLGEPGSGFPMIMQSFQWERLALAVAAVAATCFDLAKVRDRLTSAHVAERDEWLGLVREMAAARALAYAALPEVVAGRDAVAAVSGAKWRACDLAVRAAGLRLHLAAEADETEQLRAERALRDARLGPIGGGAREVMAELVARSLPLG